MNRKTIIGIVLVLLTMQVHAQKPVIDSAAIHNWPTIDPADVKSSPDGNWIRYIIQYGANYSSNVTYRARVLLWSINKKAVFDPMDSLGFNDDKERSSGFSGDNNYFLFTENDRLHFLNLNSFKDSVVSDVLDFSQPKESKSPYIFYRCRDNSVRLCNTTTGTTIKFNNVQRAQFSPSAKWLLLTCKKENKYNVRVVDINTRLAKDIYVGNQVPGESAFSKDEKTIAFITEDGTKDAVWIYREGEEKASQVINADDVGIPEGMRLSDSYVELNGDGSRLFFNLEKRPPDTKPLASAAPVTIWNYKDEFLPTEQLDRNGYYHQQYKAMLDVTQNRITRLQQDKDGGGKFSKDYHYYLLTTVASSLDDYGKNSKPDLYLINTNNGQRIRIASGLYFDVDPDFSPSGKYIYWYDMLDKAYYTYNILTGKKTNISKGVTYPLYIDPYDYGKLARSYGIAGWTTSDKDLLVYDKYDLWSLDPTGLRKPLNFTRGYGRAKKTQLRRINFYHPRLPDEHVVADNEPVLLCGSNFITKDNGFFQISYPKGTTVQTLSSSGKLSYLINPNDEVDFDLPHILIELPNNKGYVLTQEKSDEFPNLCYSKDFKNFVQISDLQPQQHYNWLTSSLLNWKTPSGKSSMGILYKPEDFDPHKKYPVIFFLYRRFSDALNVYQRPDLSSGRINIPWFVSRGYVVFCPDLRYTYGDPGRGLMDYILSAVGRLKQFSWVDTARFGVQGHSFGGWEVDYIVSHTNAFAAAISAAGASDLVSNLGQFVLGGWDSHHFTEDIYMMRHGLDEAPKAYINNSPVFHLNDVKTPLLIVHNNNDENVPVAQAIEFYTDLRYVHKKVWMLQYDDQAHVTTGDSNSFDLTMRMQQFYDYYLKGKIPPVWMTQGVPRWQKQYKTGLELDHSGRQP